MTNKPDKYHLYSICAIAQFEGLKALNFYETPYIDAAIELHKDGYYLSPNIDSGLMSPEAYNNAISGKSRENTQDHYRSRSKSSRDFYNHYDEGRFNLDRLERVESWYKSRCRVHTITRQQNTDLIPYQTSPNLRDKHYSVHYGAIGINKLVPRPDLRNKFVYVVEGHAYNNAQDVAEDYGITAGTVRARCNSRSEKFKEWKKIPKRQKPIKVLQK